MKGKYVSFVVMMMLLSFGYTKVYATSVNYSYPLNIKSCGGCTTTSISASGIKGTVQHNLHKNFYLTMENGTIAESNFVLDVGKTITSKEESTVGEWFYSGGFSDSPPADGVWYSAIYYKGIGNYVGIPGQYGSALLVSVTKPIDSAPLRITSSDSNILECIKNICKAKNKGVATVQISFPDKTQSSKYNFDGSVNYGYGYTTTGMSDVYGYVSYLSKVYSFPSITYTVTVPGTPNTAQVSTCTGATGITKDSATVNWSYTDLDNDPQTQYQVQLSKKSYIDPTFTNTDIVFASSSASANTSHTFTGLTPNTTYYARIKTQNAVNGWSTVYSTCNAGFKTSEDPNTPPPTCACNSDRDYVCKKTDGTVTSTDPNSSQCNFASYCSVATTTTTTTFTFGPIGHRIGSVKYEHPGVIETKTGPNYIYTYQIPIKEDKQELTVVLTDLGDDTKLLPKTCSVTNNSTPPGGGTPPPSPCGDKYKENETTCLVDTYVTWKCDTNAKQWYSISTGNPCDPTTPLTPKIKITKKPAITLNKGGKCTLDWTITNRPDDMKCTLTGTGVTTPISLSDKNPGTWTSPALFQNTKYTIKCTSSTLATTISASTICRINPSIGEI